MTQDVSTHPDKILVIGANGYIGRHVCQRLKNGAFPFTAADIHEESLDGHEYCSLNIQDAARVAEVLDGYGKIMLFAGMTGTLNGFQKYREFIELNEIGLLNVLSALSEKGSRCKVLLPSTRLVYKGEKDRALKEDAEKEFNTVYAATKYAGESYLRMYQKSFGVDYLIVRVCVPYGSSFSSFESYGTISHFVAQAKRGRISIFGAGEQKRSLIHVDDLARLLIAAFRSPKTVNDVYNLGGPDVFSVREIAERVGAPFGANVVSTDWTPDQLRVESGDTIFDSSKLLDVLGESYAHTFDEWIDSLKDGR